MGICSPVWTEEPDASLRWEKQSSENVCNIRTCRNGIQKKVAKYKSINRNKCTTHQSCCSNIRSSVLLPTWTTGPYGVKMHSQKRLPCCCCCCCKMLQLAYNCVSLEVCDAATCDPPGDHPTSQPPIQGLQHLQSSSICNMATQIGSLGQLGWELIHRMEGASRRSGFDFLCGGERETQHNNSAG